jgi:predicted flap endonuclease-1-like 5' DNA nuclease
MMDSETKGLFSCTNTSWIVAAIFGVIVAAILVNWTDWNWLIASVVGLIGLFGAAWLLTEYFCDGAQAGSQTTVASTPLTASKPLPKPAAAVAASARAAAAPAAASVDGAPAAKKAAPKKAPAKKAASAKAAPKSATKKAAPAKSAVLPAGLAAAGDGKPALYTTAPTAVDDLKVLKGVGPALEKTLNDLGVYTFAQIKTWKKADIAWVDSNLKFKGRIERDDWVKQAKALDKGVA